MTLDGTNEVCVFVGGGSWDGHRFLLWRPLPLVLKRPMFINQGVIRPPGDLDITKSNILMLTFHRDGRDDEGCVRYVYQG